MDPTFIVVVVGAIAVFIATFWRTRRTEDAANAITAIENWRDLAMSERARVESRDQLLHERDIVIDGLNTRVTALEHRIEQLLSFNKMAKVVAAELALVTKQTAADLAEVVKQTAADLEKARKVADAAVAEKVVETAEELAAPDPKEEVPTRARP